MPSNIPGLRNPNWLRHVQPFSVLTYLSVRSICLSLPGRGFNVNVPVTQVAFDAKVACCK